FQGAAVEEIRKYLAVPTAHLKVSDGSLFGPSKSEAPGSKSGKKGTVTMRKLAIVAAVLAIMAIAAAPTLAQSASEEAEITGMIEAVANPTVEGPTHIITEDATGDQYGLFSDDQGVDLSQYEGLFVTISGIFQTLGNPLSSFEDPTDVPIYVTSVEVIGDPNSPPGTTTPDTGPVTFSFELAVEGTPPANASFFGVFGYEAGMVQLNDPDGDGLYTGSVETRGSLEPQPVRIIQGTGTQRSAVTGVQPGEPISTIKDFGVVPIEEGVNTFSASVSFAETPPNNDQYTTPEPTTPEPTTVPREPGTPPGGTKVLPDTGGLPLLALGVGALLLAGVLLVRRADDEEVPR
ncbi:MAG: hypothetical protein WA982_02090, partial [Rubrobacteraceae bacterium]